MKIYTSDEILRDDLYQLQDDACSGIPIKYQLTDPEIQWVNYITGKYCIADYIRDASDFDYLLTIDDIETLSKALDDDCKNFGKAVMLSDESALQKIFFWLYQESE